MGRRSAGSSAHGGACEGANSGCGGQGVCGSHDDACEGANNGCGGQGTDGAHDKAYRGAHAGCREGKAGQRVGVRNDDGVDGGASGYDDTRDTLTRGDGDLDSGDGFSQVSRSDG
jgi:hypothetical protein